MKKDQRGWGIWLKDQREWATLPPRLCKPTPHNSDLNEGLIGVIRKLDKEGHSPELRRIPKDDLSQMRKENK